MTTEVGPWGWGLIIIQDDHLRQRGIVMWTKQVTNHQAQDDPIFLNMSLCVCVHVCVCVHAYTKLGTLNSKFSKT